MELSLDGKVALVTGGSRGIGKEIARALHGAGASVMLTSRDGDACAQAAADIGESVAWRASHVGREEDAAACIDATIDMFGRLDILVNNAATNPYAGLTIEIDRARWDKTIEINLTAPLVWSQFAWERSMRESGGGCSIINISSVGAYMTTRELGTYALTKAALVILTRQLAAELAPAVRVNAIAPGLIKTELARALWEGNRGEAMANTYPMRTLGETDDIASAAVFLASDAAKWITGHTMVIDGGGLIAMQEYDI